MQQLSLQVLFGVEIMELNQSHRKQFHGFNQCDDDCMICKTVETFTKLENHMALAHLPSRSEPFTEIGAKLIEQAILQSRSNPIVLLNTGFINSMFMCSLELIREEMNGLTASPFVSSGRLTRIHDIYHHITNEKFEKNLPLDAQFQSIPSPGDESSGVRLFKQCEPDLFVGVTSLIYIVVNVQMSYSHTNKLPARMLRWNGDVETLKDAVPKNAKYTAYIRNTAFSKGYSIGDNPVIYPDDKYDTHNDEFWINPTPDDHALNEDPTMALYPNLLDPSKRVIIG